MWAAARGMQFAPFAAAPKRAAEGPARRGKKVVKLHVQDGGATSGRRSRVLCVCIINFILLFIKPRIAADNKHKTKQLLEVTRTSPQLRWVQIWTYRYGRYEPPKATHFRFD